MMYGRRLKEKVKRFKEELNKEELNKDKKLEILYNLAKFKYGDNLFKEVTDVFMNGVSFLVGLFGESGYKIEDPSGNMLKFYDNEALDSAISDEKYAQFNRDLKQNFMNFADKYSKILSVEELEDQTMSSIIDEFDAVTALWEYYWQVWSAKHKEEFPFGDAEYVSRNYLNPGYRFVKD